LSPANITGNSIYRKKEEIVSRNIAGEIFLVPIHGNLADMQKIFTLSPVAEHIWNLLDGEKDLDSIQNDVLNTFDVGKQVAEADLHEFIAQLLEAGLIDMIDKP
jgi:hypothetical protein